MDIGSQVKHLIKKVSLVDQDVQEAEPSAPQIALNPVMVKDQVKVDFF